MSEAEVVEQLVEFTNLLLAGVSVFFTVISANVAALNYFIGGANFLARLLSFLFVTFVLAMLGSIMVGGQLMHEGLVSRLEEIRDETGLSAAGRAALANAQGVDIAGFSIDTIVRGGVWTAFGLVILVFGYLTFIHRWKAEVVPVQLTQAD
ncbi:MAG: hypothetical protein ABW199_04940 [Caulobacterales bacterium]